MHWVMYFNRENGNTLKRETLYHKKVIEKIWYIISKTLHLQTIMLFSSWFTPPPTPSHKFVILANISISTNVNNTLSDFNHKVHFKCYYTHFNKTASFWLPFFLIVKSGIPEICDKWNFVCFLQKTFTLLVVVDFDNVRLNIVLLLCPHFEEKGVYCFALVGPSVRWSVGP
jgi:hypothetical protein